MSVVRQGRVRASLQRHWHPRGSRLVCEYRGLNSESLAQTIATAKATDTLSSTLAKFRRLDLVIIDDLGILPIGENDSEALYRVVETCYETTSLIVTSNFGLASFDEILNPRSIAAALVDRLAHHAHLIETTGESIRLSQALSGKGVMPL
ncbi:transposase [Ferrimicrobium acidiphilum DSM 19497]|uniref:Transposase n=1 Tax=Ferrimicrobium acidiphilum DSM 19497 TaxID=1121877 RepID=A0A0D8FQ02_9ACTN|nr:transposase [Ferrimicrobium acidiphilum DSM 19497]